MNNKLTIYANQMARLDKLGKLYEEIAIRGNHGWEKVRKAFDNYCRVQQIKFEVTVQMLNTEQ